MESNTAYVECILLEDDYNQKNVIPQADLSAFDKMFMLGSYIFTLGIWVLQVVSMPLLKGESQLTLQKESKKSKKQLKKKWRELSGYDSSEEKGRSSSKLATSLSFITDQMMSSDDEEMGEINSAGNYGEEHYADDECYRYQLFKA